VERPIWPGLTRRMLTGPFLMCGEAITSICIEEEG
jgi:hypothetical protein